MTKERPVCLNYGCYELCTHSGSRWRPFCNNCHKESFINKEPIYEGLTKIGEKVSCTSCGFVYTNEKDIPWKNMDNFSLKEFEKINGLNFPIKKIYAEICDECGFPINNNIFIEYYLLLKYIIRKNFLLKN